MTLPTPRWIFMVYGTPRLSAVFGRSWRLVRRRTPNRYLAYRRFNLPPKVFGGQCLRRQKMRHLAMAYIPFYHCRQSGRRRKPTIAYQVVRV